MTRSPCHGRAIHRGISPSTAVTNGPPDRQARAHDQRAPASLQARGYSGETAQRVLLTLVVTLHNMNATGRIRALQHGKMCRAQPCAVRCAAKLHADDGTAHLAGAIVDAVLVTRWAPRRALSVRLGPTPKLAPS